MGSGGPFRGIGMGLAFKVYWFAAREYNLSLIFRGKAYYFIAYTHYGKLV